MAPSKGLQLTVRGVGRIRFPITPATARKLCEVARPAPFGHRTKTLLDRRVRDTWEIASDDIEVDARIWSSALGECLVTIGRRLGLPDEGDLEAVPDKMLIYGKGQFFAPHQDSERADEMVASLVVVLPSAHAGGAVVVEHRGKKAVLRGAAGRAELALLAFYADCRHQVAAVTSGYRVVLTYGATRWGERGARAQPQRVLLDARRAAMVEQPARATRAPRLPPGPRVLAEEPRLGAAEGRRPSARGSAAERRRAPRVRGVPGVRHEWPLAKDRRRHVHGQIDSYGLPVSHVTQRRGSPHTLVLEKQRALFEREDAERAKWKALVAWLKKRRPAFVGAARASAAAPARTKGKR
jgi:hypothetical protein